MNVPFELTSQYYDLLYHDKDTDKEVAYVTQLLKKFGISGPDILDFGSGTGRHGCALASQGYRVHGIERSPSMVRSSQQVLGFTCEQGDITTTKLSRHFDAVLSLFHVVSYLTSNADVSSVFANAAHHLHPGGLFLFDVWYTPAVLTQRPQTRVKRLETSDLSITRIAEPVIFHDENRVDVNYTVFAHTKSTGTFHSFEECHPMRHFSLPELRLFAEAAGFEHLNSEEWLTGSPLSEESWGICLVFRKS